MRGGRDGGAEASEVCPDWVQPVLELKDRTHWAKYTQLAGLSLLPRL